MAWALEHYNHKLNDIQTQVWYRCFKNTTADRFKEAWDYHIKNSESPFFPPPGLITRALNELQEERDEQGPRYPETTSIFMMIHRYFPGGKEFKHFPPDCNTAAWHRLYDEVWIHKGATDTEREEAASVAAKRLTLQTPEAERR